MTLVIKVPASMILVCMTNTQGNFHFSFVYSIICHNYVLLASLVSPIVATVSCILNIKISRDMSGSVSE